jgi:aubergine-like protein
MTNPIKSGIPLIDFFCWQKKTKFGFVLFKGNAVTQRYQNDFHFKKALDEHTKKNPQDRYDKLRRLVDTVCKNPEASAELKKWEITLSDDAVKFDTKVIPYNTINFHTTAEPYLSDSKGWNNALRNARHISSFDINNWLLFYTRRSADQVASVPTKLSQIARPMGFNIAEPRRIQVDDRGGGGSFYNAIKGEIEKRRPQFIMCITPSNSKDMYDAIKRLCCLDYGIPSQVIVQKTLQNDKNVMSVLSKVAIQINAKMGGEIWGVTIPVSLCMFSRLHSLFSLL